MTDRAADPPRLSAAVAKDIRWSTNAGRIVIAAAGLASTSWAYRNMVMTAADGGADPIFAWIAAGFLELGLLGSAFMARAAILSDKDSRFWMALMWVLSGASGAFSGSHELGNPSWWMPALAAGLPLAAAALWHGLIVGEHRMNAGPDVAEQAREKRTLRYDIAQDALRDTLRASRGHRAQGRRFLAWWYELPVPLLKRAEHRARVKAFHAHRNMEHFDERLSAHLEADERADAYRARRFVLGFLPSTEPETAHLSVAQPHDEAHELESAHQIEQGSAPRAIEQHTPAAEHDDRATPLEEGETQRALTAHEDGLDRVREPAQNNAHDDTAHPSTREHDTAHGTEHEGAVRETAQSGSAQSGSAHDGARPAQSRSARSRTAQRGRVLTQTEVLTVDTMKAAGESWDAVAELLGLRDRHAASRAYKRAGGTASHTPPYGTPQAPEQTTIDEHDYAPAYAAAAPSTQRND